MIKLETILRNELKEKMEEYLNWNIAQAENLLSIDKTRQPTRFASPVLDFPLLSDKEKYLDFFKIANKCGYRLFNIGLTPLWDRKIKDDTIKLAEQQGIKFVSAHGTSVKLAIKQGKNFKEILEKDLKVLEKIDPQNKMVVNYDLFAGHLPGLNFFENFESTRKENIRQLAHSLNIRIGSEHSIIEYLVRNLAETFVGAERKITVEIPGTKGWSMLPELTNENLHFLFDLIDDIFPTCKITIDLAHLLTWSKDSKFLIGVVDAVRPYQEKIGMLHISSAGADNNFFIEAYKSVYKDRYPMWHIKGLDLSLFVCEKEMLYLVSELRKIIKHDYLEVSETRLPFVVIKDYFPDFIIEDLDYFYSKGLFLQSKLLNYL